MYVYITIHHSITDTTSIASMQMNVPDPTTTTTTTPTTPTIAITPMLRVADTTTTSTTANTSTIAITQVVKARNLSVNSICSRVTLGHVPVMSEDGDVLADGEDDDITPWDRDTERTSDDGEAAGQPGDTHPDVTPASGGDHLTSSSVVSLTTCRAQISSTCELL